MFRNYKGVVAWYNPEQFRKVYHSLYSNDLTEKRWAVDQISVWETRCHPSLPTAVEATAVIVRAVIQDALFESNATLCQENEIQMFYAMALVRFINLIFELRQNSFNKKRLSVIAKRLRIPAWIVELRNFATHSYLPSLPVLRKGAKAALDYLNRTFWRKEAKHVQSIVKIPDTEDIVESVVRTIKEFQAQQYHRLYIERSTKVRDKATISVFSEMKKLIRHYRERFIEIFLQPDLFILNEQDLENVLSEAEKIFLCDDTYCELPTALEVFWLPVIRSLHHSELIPDFVELMLLKQTDELICQKQVVAWAIKFIQAGVFFFPESQMTNYFLNKGVSYNWKRLLYACTKNPCKFTPYLLPVIASHEDLDKESLKQIVLLVAISQGQAVDGCSQLINNRARPFTLDEAKKLKALEDKFRQRNNPPEESIWSLAPDDIDYRKLPIGAILNPLSEDAERSADTADEQMEVSTDVSKNEISEYCEDFIIT
ncbi:uncharacterized protein LOC118183211 isoform X2 [Stegodyphus dumicola]|nr:uncharacterized protein LOC118183211 isoform X2 [Stegodyphus dumicola]